MTVADSTDWNPGAYHRFRGLRLRPALDLLSAVPELPAGAVVDLGCGSGVMGAALSARCPEAELIGVDTSPSMLKEAAASGNYHALEKVDIAAWTPNAPPALIYSNATLQWLGDHETLMPALAGMLAPGGVLAVQMPFQNAAPSHEGWQRAFRSLFGARSVERGPEILAPERYFDMLAPLGDCQIWQTEYFQHLQPSDRGHPVRRFTESTFARPFLAALDDGEQEALIAAYEQEMAQAYPLRADGSVLFRFRRLFLLLKRD